MKTTLNPIKKLRKAKAKRRQPPQCPDEQVFANGSSHFAALLQDIASAQQSIDLETYIYQKDHLGQRIADALAAAAQRGVTVRVLVDGCGSPLWSTGLAKVLENAGAQTRVFHPFPWQLWNWSRSVMKRPMILKWVYLLLNANIRNHRKVCIIDHQIAYIGSVNISKDHLRTEDGGNNWRDASVRLTGLDLHDLSHAFDCAWHHRSIQERLKDAFRHVRRDPIIRLNYTRHRRRLLYKQLLRRMRQCKQRIWITNAYFVPDQFLLRRLREAASAGIDVRILLPKKSDVFVMPWASSTFYQTLLRAGVRIFEYLPSNLHAKTLILDDWITLGSSNLNHRSLLHDLEADVSITGVDTKKQMEQFFLHDLDSAKEISLTNWEKHRPYRQTIMGKLALFLKYWI